MKIKNKDRKRKLIDIDWVDYQTLKKVADRNRMTNQRNKNLKDYVKKPEDVKNIVQMLTKAFAKKERG